MIPKEKAQELFNKYYDIEWLYEGYNIFMPKEKAKECALIAVDEIINQIAEVAYAEIATPAIIYWKKVKQEIEKL